MRALVCHEYGSYENLRIDDVAGPAMKPGHVRIGVRAAGVSFAAMLGVQGKHQNKPKLPYIPGNEVAGVVLEVAPDVSEHKVGDRVVGPASSGGYAQEALAPAANIHRMPDS